ncbi:MAG: helix-turn-helix domain-containing protein [Pseudomonadota bacterium]
MQSSEDRLLDRREVEELFGISKRFLEVSVQRGGGPPFIRIGRLVRYRTCDIRTWIQTNRVSSI